MPPVANPDITCWMKMSISSNWGGATAAPPPDPPTGSGATPSASSSRRVHSSRSVAQIGAADGVVLPEVGGRARDDHAAGLEQIGVIGHRQRHGRVLLD